MLEGCQCPEPFDLLDFRQKRVLKSDFEGKAFIIFGKVFEEIGFLRVLVVGIESDCLDATVSDQDILYFGRWRLGFLFFKGGLHSRFSAEDEVGH